MRIVCDYTGIALEAAPEVSEALCERGFTAAEPFLAPAERPLEAPGGGEAQVLADPGPLPLLPHAAEPSDGPAPQHSGGDGGEVQAPAEQPAGPAPAASAAPSFEGWENTKEFLKEREIANLRAYAAANSVELPRPANKGQIVNAIVAALGE